MDRVQLKHLSVRARNPLAGWQPALERISLALFALNLGSVCLMLVRPGAVFGDLRWPEGLLLILSVITTVASLSGQIPAQNAVLVSLLIAFLGGAVEFLGAITAVPFGPFVYNKEKIGAFLLNPLPWAAPIFWVVALLNARGVGRLILRKYRYRRNYGFVLMGVTALLVVIIEMSFEPYAVWAKEYWSWKPTKLGFSWYSAPLTNSVGWGVTSLLILLFVTPALINKSPVKRPPAYHPLIMWELLSFLFFLGATLHGLRGASVFIAGQMVSLFVLAVVGARAGGHRSSAIPSL